MKLYMLQPEVAGWVGGNSVITNLDEIKSGKDKVHEVSHLEYQFDTWLGDELLAAYSGFIVTESLAKDLTKAGLTGVKLTDVEISKSDVFKELYPNRRLPRFRRLIPEGRVELDKKHHARKWAGHDFCQTERAELVVTEQALNVLKKHKLDHCEIEELS
ncbi:MAG TPA: hypothetical protein VF131_26805 [Blastocatellia bacterium]|nr:hypothetical protein [Blastocatellia bacterium]